MPKINVYLPDDLAAAVRAAGFAVSPVCQQALAAAVRSVNTARKAISAIRDPAFDPDRHPDILTGIEGRMTARLSRIFSLTRQAGTGPTGTVRLLLGLLDEGGNLGLRVLQAVDIDTDALRDELPQDGADDGEADGAAGELTRPAWRAIAGAVEAAVDLGHNYVGSEHLVLGLIAETDGAAGRVLQRLGAEPASARKAMLSILAGYASGRQATLAADAEVIGDLRRRLDALETRVAALPGVSA
ncbi:MAG TPA: Clp protease N-terminal domain-containing protein [Streptosporangiaceae bacterium]|jgi:ATP-dependent Clp protease ATP-binding subunit ClpC